jgi:hypothetical protein
VQSPHRRSRQRESAPAATSPGEIAHLWVPKTYATRRYSWMTPPGAVMPPDPEMIQVVRAIWQGPQ